MNLSGTTTFIISPAVVASVDTITIHSLIDERGAVVADIAIASSRKRIKLWDANTTPTYTEMGDWSQAQAEARIVEVLLG